MPDIYPTVCKDCGIWVSGPVLEKTEGKCPNCKKQLAKTIKEAWYENVPAPNRSIKELFEIIGKEQN